MSFFVKACVIGLNYPAINAEIKVKRLFIKTITTLVSQLVQIEV